MHLASNSRKFSGALVAFALITSSTGAIAASTPTPPSILDQPAGGIECPGIRLVTRRAVRRGRCGRRRCRHPGRKPGLRVAGRGSSRGPAAGRRRSAAAAGCAAARRAARQRRLRNFPAAAGARRGRRSGWAVFPAAEEKLVKPELRSCILPFRI